MNDPIWHEIRNIWDAIKGLRSIETPSKDGWIGYGATWTYASATTFTVSGDQTAIFAKGTKIKLTQTTVKYFYVTASSYSSPNTTVAITGGSDYTLSNAAITNPAYSYASPPDFPGWFNFGVTWTAQVTAASLGNGTLESRFNVVQNKVTQHIKLTAGSTTTFGTGIWRFNKPITATSLLGNGVVRMIDDSEPAATETKFAFVFHVTANLYYLRGIDGDQVDYDWPFTWAQDDSLELSIEYEI